MRKIIVLILAVVGLMAYAQSKINYSGRQLSGDPAETLSAVVLLNNKGDNFGAVDVKETTRIGSIAIIEFNAGQLEQIAALPQVKQIQLSSDVKKLETSPAYDDASLSIKPVKAQLQPESEPQKGSCACCGCCKKK